MKYHHFAFLILAALNCKAQDTARHQSKHSVSFTGGVNEITGFAPLSISAGPWFDPIRPSASVQPYFSLSYTYNWYKTTWISMGLKLGIGYSQNRYMGEIPWEISYGPPQLLAQINTGEFSAGIVATILGSDKLGWYNELDFTGNVQLSPTVVDKSAYLIDQSEFTNGKPDLHLFYHTGLSIRINKNFTLIPMTGCSIVDVSSLLNKATPYGIYGYVYARGELMVTYNFNKK